MMEGVEEASRDAAVKREALQTAARDVNELGLKLLKECLTKFKAPGSVEDFQAIELTLSRSSVPPEVVLEIVDKFNEIRPDLVKRALFQNLGEAVSYHITCTGHPSTLPRYLHEYFNAELPLDLVKATFLYIFSHSRLDMPYVDFRYIELFNPGQTTPPAHIQKMEEVTLHLARYAFDILLNAPADSWADDAFRKLLIYIAISPSVVQSLLSWSLGLATNDREAVIIVLMARIMVGPNRLKHVEETFLLEDEFHRLQQAGSTTQHPRLALLYPDREDQQKSPDTPVRPYVITTLMKTLGRFANQVEPSPRGLYDDPQLRKSLKTIDRDETIFHGRKLKDWLLLVYRWCDAEGYTQVLRDELIQMKGRSASEHFDRLINSMRGLADEQKLRKNEETRKEYFDRVNRFIEAQPNHEEILQDKPRKAREYANEIAREMLGEDSWNRVLDARWKYLWCE